jgi:hypothetical protein
LVGLAVIAAAVLIGGAVILLSRSSAHSPEQAAAPAPPEECDLGLGPREVVMTAARRRELGLRNWPDSVFGVLKQGDTYTFFASSGGPPSTSTKLVGTLDNPAAKSVQATIAIQNLKNVYDYVGGGPIYRDPATGNLLMFYHAEKWPKGDGSQFWALYGMANSVDGGDTWSDLGEIVTPEVPYLNEIPPGTPPFARTVPLPSAPFIVIGDYFYVYAKNRSSYDQPLTFLTVARAPLKDVLAAAQRNAVVPWFKYYNGDWKEPGLGGKASPLEAANPPLRQFDIAYDDYLGRYVGVLIAPTAPNTDAVYLIESNDGFTWSKRRLIDEEPGDKLYPTIVGTGDDPKVVGRQFYVYYPGDSPGSNDDFLVRRLVSCEPGLRAHATLSASLDGSHAVSGRLAEGSGASVAGATVELALKSADGPGTAKVYKLSGTVPVGATQAIANLNFLRQAGGTGPIDFAVYDVRYSEAGDPAQRVPNGDFSQGLQGWGGSGGSAQVKPSDRGAGNLLQLSASPGETGLRTSARFRVTPGASFTATFTARVSASSADAGFLGINFQDASGGMVSREIVGFKPAEVTGTAKTDEQGGFRLSFDDLGSSRFLLEARYSGDGSHWSAYLRKLLAP